MIPYGLMTPALQRMEEVLEDLEALDQELGQIARHPELPWYLVREAEQKAAQATDMLSQVVALVPQILAPFAEERAALKAAQEAVLHVPYQTREEPMPREGKRRDPLLPLSQGKTGMVAVREREIP
ncbi:MAG TPA: hypothetical protein VFV38_51475 [Ktedonobacteraceae bacterium]|nr:hypothetical protein [Ktedonobacteraceae bacterium]